jgi:hypothetical protein
LPDLRVQRLEVNGGLVRISVKLITQFGPS